MEGKVRKIGFMASEWGVTSMVIVTVTVLLLMLLNFTSIKTLQEIKQITNVQMDLISIAEVIGGIYILKFSRRSILLPISAILIGGVMSNTMTEKQLIWMHSVLFFQVLFSVGVVGLIISAFSID